jgi:hypothetical protein
LAAPTYKRKILIADQFTPAQRAQFVKIYNTWQAKHMSAKIMDQQFRETLSMIGSTKERITNEMLKSLKVCGFQRHGLRAAADIAAQKLRTLDDKLAKKLYATKTVDHGEQWLVGGMCAE